MKTDTPETDAVREMWFMKPNVELGDGRPIHGNVVDVEFARRMERERNEAREAYTAETQSTMEMTRRIIELEGCLRTEGMRIENLKADRDHWRNKHSELFMKLNPITDEILGQTLKLSRDHGWRGVCCSEHNP